MTPLIDSDLLCARDARRAALLRQRDDLGIDITGIDYIVVSADQRSLEVFFIDREPPAELITGRLDLFEVSGGRRVAVRVTAVDVTGGSPSALLLHLSSPGDFSDYVLEIHPPSGGPTILDELFRRVAFNFKVQCPARFDCEPPAPAIEPLPPGIEVDYLAKDYASFRQALVDLIPRLSPQWTQRLAADLGITVLELLAYVADQLSYYQDAVANEAYLETARQRVSVRRHARLVDYQMHDGASARAYVHVALKPGMELTIDPDTTRLQLLTRIDVPIGAAAPKAVIAASDRDQALDLADAVFETFTGGRLHWRLNRIELHDWGDEGCVLPRGATSADLRTNLSEELRMGDLMLFEETADQEGDVTLADPAHRQVVRLTSVEYMRDNLLAVDVTRVSWDPADALAFPLAIGWTNGEELTVARGNILLADHGRTVVETGRTADPLASGNRAPRFLLEQGPLSFRPRPPATGPAAVLAWVDPHGAEPQVSVSSAGGDWTTVDSLVRSGPFETHVAVETADDGRALLRFGDNTLGLAPEFDDVFEVAYRVGVGVQGNIGSDSLTHVIVGSGLTAAMAERIESVWNPLPTWGGIEPESVDAVRSDAPAAFRATQHRAVTEADYAAIAERHALVRRAVARFRWTGSWHTVFISIDPAGRHGLEDVAEDSIAAFVDRYAQAGYDLEIVPPHYVPLGLTLVICVEPDHFRPDVEEAVRSTLTSGIGPHGRPGFFHPDHFTFGQPLYLSRLYAAVAEVDGVESVVATRFGRLSDDDPESGGAATDVNLERGEITIGPLEIARLDDDPDFPENGLLHLTMLGGK